MPSKCWFPFPSPRQKTESIPVSGIAPILGRKSHGQSGSRNECFQGKPWKQYAPFYLRRAESQFWVLHFLSDKRGHKNELTGVPAGRHTERVGLTEGRPCPEVLVEERGLQSSELGTAQQSPRDWQPMLVTKVIPIRRSLLTFSKHFLSFYLLPPHNVHVRWVLSLPSDRREMKPVQEYCK